MIGAGLLGAVAGGFVVAEEGGGARWWSTDAEMSSSTTQSGYNGITVRIVLLAGMVIGNKVRFRFQAQPALGTSVSAVYVQLAATSGDVYDFASTPVEVTFSGASGFSLSADAYIDSDEISLAVTTADAIVVSFRVTSTNSQKRSSNYIPGLRMFYKNANEAATVNVGSYTEQTWPVMLVRAQSYDLEPVRTTLYKWTTVTRNDNWAGWNIRLVLPAGFFTSSFTKLRLRMLCTGTAYVVSRVFFGTKAASGDAYDFAAAPSEVLWGGASGKSMGTQSVAVSDDLTYSVDASTQYIIAMHIASGASVPNAGKPASSTIYKKSAADESGTANVTGYSTDAIAGMPIFWIEAW